MNTTSKYFDSIKISSNKKAKVKVTTPCAFMGCEKSGPYRAPIKGRGSKAYLHFCLEHVRDYNKNFNFFDQLTDEEKHKYFHSIRATTKEAIFTSTTNVGSTNKPSENFAKIRSGSAAYQKRIGNNIKLFGSGSSENRRTLSSLEMKAFIVLDLAYDASSEDIKIKYKALVKEYHPDSNGGDRSLEERLNEIIKAYKTLQKGGFC